ncbi:MAG: YraN family protein [Chloroflexota bacterium]
MDPDPASPGPTRTSQQRIGDEAEALVLDRLRDAGWTILGRNVHLGRSELDIVAVDPGPPPALVVVEVRRRGRRDFGLAEETLDHRKRAALRRAIGTLLEVKMLPDGSALPPLALRIDLVAVDPGRDGRTSVRHHRGIAL